MRLASLALVGVLALSACAQTGGPTAQPPSVSQIATDVNLLATGLIPVVTALATTPGVDPKVVAAAQTALQTIQNDAKVLAASVQPSPDIVSEVVQTVEVLAGLTGTVPALAPFAPAIQAAVALLPVILQVANINIQASPPAIMPAAQARMILAAPH